MSVMRMQHVSVPMPMGGGDQARHFYSGALGLDELTTPTTLDADQIIWFKVGDDGQELHVFTEEGSGPNSAGQHVCLQVDDLGATLQRLSDGSVTSQETIPIANRPRCFILDPFGNRIELTQILGQYE